MITASIVTYHNPYDEVKLVVDCAYHNDIDKVYLIDHSSDDTLRKLETDYPQICYIKRENTGYGSGHNVAINKAIKEDKSDYHAVLNPDIYFEEGIIRILVDRMDGDKAIGQIMPKIYYPSGELQYLCKLMPTPTDLILRRFLPSGVARKRKRKFQLEFTGYESEMNVPFLSGCFMFLRCSALEEVGLFDERFFMYGEDIDLSRRIHRKFKTLYFPQVSIVHNHKAESYKNKKMLYVHMKSISKYFNKWGWMFDRERKSINKNALKALKYYK